MHGAQCESVGHNVHAFYIKNARYWKPRPKQAWIDLHVPRTIGKLRILKVCLFVLSYVGFLANTLIDTVLRCEDSVIDVSKLIDVEPMPLAYSMYMRIVIFRVSLYLMVFHIRVASSWRFCSAATCTFFRYITKRCTLFIFFVFVK